jgi:hypothetical protein
MCHDGASISFDRVRSCSMTKFLTHDVFDQARPRGMFSNIFCEIGEDGNIKEVKK